MSSPKVLVVGTPERLKEAANTAIANIATHQHALSESLFTEDLAAYDIIFDLNLDEFPENQGFYFELNNTILIGCAVKMTLSEMLSHSQYQAGITLLGINALPTFLSREVLECSYRNPNDRAYCHDILTRLGLKIAWVQDQVGMVTMRVLSLIINEAYFMLEEGTANRTDIDSALKLGTNYPYGPLEWSEKIGIKHVVDVLHALQTVYGTERFRISRYLKNPDFVN